MWPARIFFTSLLVFVLVACGDEASFGPERTVEETCARFACVERYQEECIATNAHPCVLAAHVASICAGLAPECSAGWSVRENDRGEAVCPTETWHSQWVCSRNSPWR